MGFRDFKLKFCSLAVLFATRSQASAENGERSRILGDEAPDPGKHTRTCSRTLLETSAQNRDGKHLPCGRACVFIGLYIRLFAEPVFLWGLRHPCGSITGSSVNTI